MKKISTGESCWLDNGALLMVDIGNRYAVVAGKAVTGIDAYNSLIAGNSDKLIELL